MTVILQHKQAFKDILANYQPSDDTVAVLADIPLVILQGITGSGRNTIISKLVARGGYYFIVSDTTRPPKLRDGVMEQNGVQYFFRSEEEVLEDLHDGQFLEAELIHDQQVSGISIRELKRAHDSGLVSINEVAREGVENIHRLKPNTIIIFVVPPSYDVWMQRLMARETMSPVELANRTASAALEIEEALQMPYFHFVINDDIEQAATDVDQIVHGNRSDESQARRIAEELLSVIRQRFSTH